MVTELANPERKQLGERIHSGFATSSGAHDSVNGDSISYEVTRDCSERRTYAMVAVSVSAWPIFGNLRCFSSTDSRDTAVEEGYRNATEGCVALGRTLL